MTEELPVIDLDLEIALNQCDDFFFGESGIAINWNEHILLENEENDLDSENQDEHNLQRPVSEDVRRAVDNISSLSKEFQKCDPNSKFHKFCETITEEQLYFIRNWYRDLKSTARRQFLSANIKLSEPERKCSTGVRNKRYTATYFLPDSKFSSVKVCQKKFTSTLGYTSNQVIKTWVNHLQLGGVLSEVNYQGRPKIDREVVMEHIENYMPQLSHYHRANASNVRYLPRYLTINEMYLDFVTKYGGNDHAH